MGLKYTNNAGVSLALAVFLMYDKYDYDERPNSISATGLIRPLRQLVLSHQNKDLLKQVDIADLVASRMGSAIHDGCEEAWTNKANVAKALKVLGASEAAINTIKINPDKVQDGDVPVYLEQRAEKTCLAFVITGKYDLVLDGVLNDYKSTSTWTYIYDSNAENYTKQGSIYKWLSPDKITSEYININYIFTDWSATKARQDSSYPQQRVLTKRYPLWSTAATEAWITNKLEAFARLIDLPQELLPECSSDELWESQTIYKYYKNPDKMTKATKNSNTMDEALAYKANKGGGAGVIVEVPGEVKACRYCPVVAICRQAEALLAAGRLVL